jgi:hypothetical protein
VVAAALREVQSVGGIHWEPTYLHAARRLPAAENLQWRRHASSTVSGFDPAAGERLLRRCALMAGGGANAVTCAWELLAGVEIAGGGARRG